MDWNAVRWLLGLAGIVGLSWVARRAVPRVVNRYIDNKVDQRFKLAVLDRQAELTAEQATRQDSYTRELERLKADLNKEADAIRHRQQRELTDFGLFTAKRQAVYAEAYALLHAALKRFLTNRDPNVWSDDYDQWNREFLGLELAAAGASASDVERIKRTWQSMSLDKRPAYARGVMSAAREHHINTAREAAHTYARANALYFRADTLVAYDDVLSLIGPKSNAEDDTLDIMTDNLRLLMQGEISGDASELANNTPAPNR